MSDLLRARPKQLLGIVKVMRVQVFSLHRVGAFAGAAKEILAVLQMLRATHIGHSSAYLVNGIGTVRHSFHNSHQTVVVCAAQSFFAFCKCCGRSPLDILASTAENTFVQCIASAAHAKPMCRIGAT